MQKKWINFNYFENIFRDGINILPKLKSIIFNCDFNDSSLPDILMSLALCWGESLQILGLYNLVSL